MGIASKHDLPKLNVFIGRDHNEPPKEMQVVADTGTQVNVAGTVWHKGSIQKWSYILTTCWWEIDICPGKYLNLHSSQ